MTIYIVNLLRNSRGSTWTYQADKDTEELHDVSVGHRVQPPHQGVEDRNERWDNHRHLDVDVHDDTQGGS